MTATPGQNPKIVVAGAGAIGCFVGGMLAVAGREVTFLGRARVADEIAANGLSVTDLDGANETVTNAIFETHPECMTGADIVLVAVKSSATQDIATQIAEFAPEALVISLQNGISNPDTLRAALPNADVRGAVVGFNVVQPGPGQFHKATSGDIWIEGPAGQALAVLDVTGLSVEIAQDIRVTQWGKLLVNLNNALNALSGLTLVEQLENRVWRRVLATQMTETLRVLKAAGITPARFSPVAPALVPHILRLPTPLFRRIAKTMINIDPQARSSMQEDLRLGRMTEIDALQGEVLALADRHKMQCPTMAKVVAAIRATEAQNAGPPGLDPVTLV